MPRWGGTRHVLAAIAVLLLVQEEGSVEVGTRLETPPGSVWAVALNTLLDLNLELDVAITEYEDDVVEEEELERRIDEIERLKREAMASFPDVGGVSFFGLYSGLGRIDDDLDEARDAINDITASESHVLGHLKDARAAKDSLEDLIDSSIAG